jgi:hypothetical protein
MSLRFEALHNPLSSPDRLVRILRPIIQPFVGVMLDTQHDLSPCCAIGSQLIGDDHTGHPSLTLQELAPQSLGGLGISAALNENLQHETVLINCAPQPLLLATD